MAAKWYVFRDKEGEYEIVYGEWADILPTHKGIPCKGFTNEQAARECFLEKGLEPEEDPATLFIDYTPDEGEILVFTDGAAEQDPKTRKLIYDLGYGVVITQYKEGKIYPRGFLAGQIELPHKGDSKAYCAVVDNRNITGECHSAILAMEYCRVHGVKNMTLVYDYDGVGKTCIGTWNPKNESPLGQLKEYYNKVARNNELKVNFVRTPSHLVEGANELGIDVKDKFYKALGDGKTLDETKLEKMVDHFYFLIGNYNADQLANQAMISARRETRNEAVDFGYGKFNPDEFVTKDFAPINQETALSRTLENTTAYRIFKDLGLI